MTSAPSPSLLPLCVDLDDTLILTDCFFLQVKTLILTQPWLLPVLFLRFITGGRPRAKAWLSGILPIDAAALPYRSALIDYLKQQKARGRKLYLVSASNENTVSRVAAHLGFFDGAFGSSSTVNLKAKNKAAFIKKNIAADFVYAGDAFADLAVWKESKGAILCGKAVAFNGLAGVPVEARFPHAARG